eukprot:TRINITY_DN8146_c0_g1_i1.p1 TRINITY_DN8146_c0_g1~~TRINITY_DN8146_c0_g1_i1.p1  ORF type:complete len:609 (+),score=134.88 TRINITY_DN8146_c0_g1_i1:240-1829(+)
MTQGKGGSPGKEKNNDPLYAQRQQAIRALRFKEPHERTAEEVGLLNRLVRGNAFYAQLEDDVREEACRSMVYVEFQTKELIIQQGAPADMCYMLLKGSAGIWVDTRPPPEGNKDKDKDEDKSPKKTFKKALKGTPSLTKGLTAVAKSALTARKTATKAFVTQPDEPAEDEAPPMEFDPETGGPIGSQLVKVLEDGALFGEAGLLHGARRNASIVAKETCQLGAISKAVFEKILRAAFAAQEQKRVDFIRQHMPKTASGADHAQALGQFFSAYTANRGHVLCQPGKVIDRLLLVHEGFCKVFLNRFGQPQQEIGSVGPGQLIGITSLVSGQEPEPYAIICATPQVKLLRMEANDARSRLPAELRQALIAVEQQRMDRLEGRVKFLDAAYGRLKGEPDKSIQELLDAGAKESEEAAGNVDAHSSYAPWLGSPFLRNKQMIQNQDQAAKPNDKLALLTRFYTDKPNQYHKSFGPAAVEAEVDEDKVLCLTNLDRAESPVRDGSPLALSQFVCVREENIFSSYVVVVCRDLSV